MGTANLDLVRSIYADWERGDFGSAKWADSEIEFVIADGPAPGSWTGVAGLAEGSRDWLDAWESWRFQVREYRVLDGERVLAVVQVSARGKTSGLEIGELGLGSKGVHLFHIRNGKVTRLVLGEHAHAVLGLTPEPG
jgi:hypothetical protein